MISEETKAAIAERAEEYLQNGDWRGHSNSVIMVRLAYIAGESHNAEREWIYVKDQYPPDGTFEVLVKVDEPFFGQTEPKLIVAYWDSDLHQWLCDLTNREVYHVTHWMPLPESPKQKTNTRKPGCYRVKFEGVWIIAEWWEGAWWRPGREISDDNDDFEQIDETPIDPAPSQGERHEKSKELFDKFLNSDEAEKIIEEFDKSYPDEKASHPEAVAPKQLWFPGEGPSIKPTGDAKPEGLKLRDIPKPTGSFILDHKTATGTMTPNGAYYHYTDVCTLMRDYNTELLQAYREMREALESLVKSDLCGEIYDDGSVVSSVKLRSAKSTLEKHPEL